MYQIGNFLHCCCIICTFFVYLVWLFYTKVNNMKIITTQTRNGPVDYGVYEHVAEWDKAVELLGARLVSLDDLYTAVTGDYLKSDNGYYVPIVDVRKLSFASKIGKPSKGKTDLWVVRLPKQELRVEFFTASGFRKRRVFNYIPELAGVDRKKKFVTPRNKLLIRYVEAGFDIYDAFNLVYPGYKSIHRIDQLLSMIIENPNFVEYLKKESKLVSLKEEFRKGKVDEIWLATQLKTIIEDSASNAQLRMKALEMTMHVLGQKTQADADINMAVAKQGFAKELMNEIKIVEKVKKAE